MVNMIASADAMGDVRDAKPLEATAKQAQSALRWTRLDLTRITFNDNISYLSPAEQTLLTKQGRDFYPLGMTVNPEATNYINLWKVTSGLSFNIVVRNRDNWGLIVGSNRDKGMSDVDGVRRVEQVAVDGFGDELAGYSFSPCPFFRGVPYIASDGGDGRRRKANRKGN